MCEDSSLTVLPFIRGDIYFIFNFEKLFTIYLEKNALIYKLLYYALFFNKHNNIIIFKHFLIIKNL